MNKPYQPDEMRQKQDFEKAKRDYAQAEAERGDRQEQEASRAAHAHRAPDEEE